MNSFLSWYYNDKEWEGTWSDNMEGYINIDDENPPENINPSNTNMTLLIEVKNGQIDGAIVNRKICETLPILRFVMINGSVNGNTADVIAWNIIEGKRKEFARLKLQIDGARMIVKPTEGAMEWFPNETLVSRQTVTEINEHDKWDVFKDSCKVERDLIFKEITQNSFEGPEDKNGRRRLKGTEGNVN